jgi:hypothetical protein
MSSGAASDALRWLCTNHQDLQVLADAADCVEQLTDLLRQARDGEDITSALRALLRQVDGPELTARGIELPGIAPRSAGETYTCPGARCAIEFRREPGEAVPRCVVDDTDLVMKFS